MPRVQKLTLEKLSYILIFDITKLHSPLYQTMCYIKTFPTTNWITNISNCRLLQLQTFIMFKLMKEKLFTFRDQLKVWQIKSLTNFSPNLQNKVKQKKILNNHQLYLLISYKHKTFIITNKYLLFIQGIFLSIGWQQKAPPETKLLKMMQMYGCMYFAIYSAL
jgi:hypothetical protein